MSIERTIQALENFNRIKERLVIDLARRHEQRILEMNTKEQLEGRGTDSNGQPLRPPYGQQTVRRKRKKGQVTTHVTLKDTGDYHDSFFIIYRDTEFEIDAQDDKKQFLERRYGDNIYGLDDQSTQELIDLIEPDMTETLVKMLP